MGLPLVHTRALTLRDGPSGHSALRFLTLLLLHHNASRRELPIGVRVYHVIAALPGLQEEPTGTRLQDLTVLAESCCCSSLAAITRSVRASDSYCTEVTLLGFCLAPTLWHDWFLSLFHGSPRLGFCLLVIGFLGNVTPLQTLEQFPCCKSCRKWLRFCD